MVLLDLEDLSHQGARSADAGQSNPFIVIQRNDLDQVPLPCQAPGERQVTVELCGSPL